MKKLCFIATMIGFSITAHAQESVRGYYRADGSYVEPYVRSAPDSNPYNNYSAQGNVNPYVGQSGMVNSQPAMQQPYPNQLLPNGSNGAYQATGGY